LTGGEAEGLIEKKKKKKVATELNGAFSLA
jgi:hypothetical protein